MTPAIEASKQESRTSAAADDATAKPLRSPLAWLPVTGRWQSLVEWFVVGFAIYVLITAVSGIGAGFKMAAGDRAGELFQFAENPFVGLVIGILATVLTQSSSTTTSITVGMVAGGLPIGIAIPILLGANIGTTVTSTLVSLGMAGDKQVFRRAFGAASVHDMYNLLSVLIFLPLELMFGILEKSSGWLADQTSGSDGGPVAAVFSAIGAGVSAFTAPGVELLRWIVSPLPEVWGGIVLILLGVVLILAVINFIGKMLKVLLVGRAERVFHTAIGRGPMSGILSGTLITVMVQSSSTTTSLAVPLVGSGKFSVKQIFPFTVGANIGTTLTALIAAFAFSGIEGQAALQAAYVHVLYNLFCAIVIFGIPFLRPIPVAAAQWLARIGAEHKLFVVAWVLGVFLVIPGLLLLVTMLL
ncbi:Na/Pi symporter [Gulosibacter sp. 10]|uniref:Na/Pi symporter n=1 Tax=Gulosibacter sp. 10 TaxID=1255570 RepID=UPI00097F20F7|nr:Na/Pi symporter [Gulosibacter sp. 10]SJM71258.1 Sodium-dependent phosphate transporter [Gulosibacter sp. 10]